MMYGYREQIPTPWNKRNIDLSQFSNYDPEASNSLEIGDSDGFKSLLYANDISDIALTDTVLSFGNEDRTTATTWTPAQQQQNFDSQRNVTNQQQSFTTLSHFTPADNRSITTNNFSGIFQINQNNAVNANVLPMTTTASTNAAPQHFTFSPDAAYNTNYTSVTDTSASVFCKEEPISPGLVVSPRPGSNISSSTHSGIGPDDTVNSYLGSSPCSSSTEEELRSATVPQRAGRRGRRKYSRDVGLSSTELERRERRRKQNRVAAEKCRLKNKAKNEETIKDYQKLQSTNTLLQNQVKTLEKQRQELQRQLDRHMAVCPLMRELPASTTACP